MLTVNFNNVLDSRILEGNYLDGVTVNFGDIHIVFKSLRADALTYKFIANNDGTISLIVSGRQGVVDFSQSSNEDLLDLHELFSEIDEEYVSRSTSSLDEEDSESKDAAEVEGAEDVAPTGVVAVPPLDLP